MNTFKLLDRVTSPMFAGVGSVSCLLDDNTYAVNVTGTEDYKYYKITVPGKYLKPVDTKSTRLQELAEDVAKLVVEKQAAYGDSFGRSGNVLREMYPNGVEPRNFDEMLTIARILDKLFRIATDPNYGGESPYRDIMGYALLGMERAESRKPRNISCSG